MGNCSSRRRIFISFALAAIFWWASPTSLRGQTVSGTILGVVQDQQGAVVTKANVSARNLETGALREAVADDNGQFRIASVPAGSYEVISTAPGFKTEVRNGIVVTVGSEVSVNFSMTVGAVSERIEVTGEAAQVDTSSSTVSGFVNSTTIRELPLNGRDWLQLALLQPGVNYYSGMQTTDATRNKSGWGLSLSIGGGRSTDNAFRVDGIVVNDYANAGPGSSLRVNMGVDTIREFSVLSNNYSAEYGRGSGGVVNAITKSGTNELHGSAYYFHRNSAFDARNFFDLTVGAPAYRRHQFGGAAGGAIKKDKTFFFGNYEGVYLLQSTSSSVSTLSPNARNGILCANSACSQTTKVSIDPRVKPWLDLYPLPNGAVTGDTGVFGYGAPRLGHENYFMGKVDHYFSATTTFAASLTGDKTIVNIPDQFGIKSSDAPSAKYNGVLSLQHLFSPTLVNTVRAGVSRTHQAASLDSSPIAALNDVSLGSLPGRTMARVFLPGNIGVITGVGGGDISSARSIFGYTTPQVYDDLSWTKGRHNIRTGFAFERIDYNMDLQLQPNGQWTFSTIQNFLQAIPSQFSGDLPSTDVVRGERQSVIAGYVQDSYRVLPNLTLNLGVRYEMSTVVKEVNGKVATLHSITDPAVTVGDPYYHNPTYKNFAPRIGFAWDPFRDGKTSVRGGYGIFDIVPLPYVFLGKMPRSAPFGLQGSLATPPSSSFPNKILPLLVPSSLTAANVEQYPPAAYKQQWNLNIQRQLTNTLALTVGYVGSAGIHQARALEDHNVVPPSLVRFDTGLNSFVFPVPAAGQPIQRINPKFGLIRTVYWNGNSNYNSLQVNLVQRPTKGLSYQIAYVWSKSIDNGSSTFTEGNEASNSSASSWALGPNNINRGVSDWDTPHSLVANFQYDVPVPQAIKAHSRLNTLLGGWQLGGIYTRQTGGPFTLKISSDQAKTGNSNATAAGQGAPPPLYTGAPGCTPNAITGNIDNYIMTQCFAFQAPGVLGNLGRHTLRMPTFRDLDFSLFKNLNLKGD